MLLATFIAGVTLLSLALTASLQVDYEDAVRLSAVGMALLLSGYVLATAIDLAHKRFPARVRRKTGRAGAAKPPLPQGLVRRIDRRAGQRIRAHAAELSRERSQCWDPTARGRVDQEKWTRAQDAFIDKVLLEGVAESHRKALKRRGGLIAAWRRRIEAAANEHDRARASAGRGVDFRPGMEGFEYEAYCARVLTEAGWKVWNKGDTGDQGVDLIAEGKGVIVAIQCKRYRGTVGNEAVQQIFAGRLTVSPKARAAVVTNADYTRSAKELAEAAGVLLLHHDDLPQLAELLEKGAPALKKAA
jgi:restriction system protein